EMSTENGLPYFFNRVNQQFSWTRPSALPKQHQHQQNQQLNPPNQYKQQPPPPPPHLNEPLACGGILADEMGMGKTIEMLSLCSTRSHSVVVDELQAKLKNLINRAPKMPETPSALLPSINSAQRQHDLRLKRLELQ